MSAVTIDQLQIEIAHDSSVAVNAINGLIEALHRLGSTKVNSGAAKAVRSMAESASVAFADSIEGTDFEDIKGELKQTLSVAGEAKSSVSAYYSTLNDLNYRVAYHMAQLNAEMSQGSENTKTFGSQSVKAFKSAAKSTKELLSAFARIAKYRLMRTIIKEIASGFKEGTDNIYQYSKALDGTAAGKFANDMDSAASSMATFKNSIGAAVSPIISALIPVLNSVVGAATNAANALARFFAIMSGKSTYSKAISYTKEYQKAAENTAGAVSNAVKEATAGIDELNVISQQSGSGGGGSSSVPDYSQMFEETGVGKISDFLSSLKLTLDDVFFDWDDLTPEQIAEKILVGLMGLCGLIAGLTLTGSLAGGLVFGIAGVALGLVIASMTFDHDGTLSNEELAQLLNMALWGAAGGAVGFVAGGVGGAALGLMIGVSIGFAINQIVFDKDGELSGDEIWRLLGATSPLGATIELTFSILGLAEGKDSSYGDLISYIIFGDESGKTNIEKRGGTLSNKLLEIMESVRIGWNIVMGKTDEDTMARTSILKGKLIAAWSTIKINLEATWLQIKLRAVGAFNDLKEGVVEAFEKLKEGIKTPINAIIGFVETMINAVIGGVNAMIDALNSINIDIDDDIPVIGGMEFSLNIPKIDEKPLPRLASGGTLENEGQMFVARESGPELVGSFGNKTGVMNNDQIVAAVSMGVYDAVVSAMGQTGNKSQSLQVFLNGKQLEASTRETKQRRGVAIASGGIYNFA